MKVFTYSDYIRCIHNLRREDITGLAEEGVQYNLKVNNRKNSNKEIDKSHDKLIKDILKDKKEVAGLANQFFRPNEKVEASNLQKCTNSFVTKKYKSQEADIVYKLKDKDLYFLIEHQSTVDYNIPFRILDYSIDIVQEWKKGKRINKISKYPTVVPIVIYTGQVKWNVPKNIKYQQIKVTTYEKYRIDFGYNFIDVNEYNIEELLEKKTMFGYGMILEKSKNTKDFVENVKSIIKIENDVVRLEKLADMIVYLFGNVLEYDEQNELLNLINEKVGGNMATLAERIKAGDRKRMKQFEKRGEREGARRGKREAIQNIESQILKLGLDEDVVKKITNVTNEELKKLEAK